MTDSPYTIRNYQPSDFASYVLLSRQAVKIEPYARPVSSQSIAEWLAWPNFSPEHDLFVVEMNGDIVGYLDIRPELGIDRVILNCWLLPEHRRKGLAGKLLECAIRRAKQLGVKAVHVEVVESNSDARTVLSKLGFNCIRDFHELKLDMSRIDWDEAEQVARECRHFKPGEEAELTRMQNRSFAEHWGYNPDTLETITFRLNLSHHSPEDVILMCHEEKIVGYCWTEVTSDVEGRISMIGSDPESRGKGIGRKVLLAGLAYLNSKGVSTAVLTVDSKNRTARNLYKSVGFKLSKTILLYEKMVD